MSSTDSSSPPAGRDARGHVLMPAQHRFLREIGGDQVVTAFVNDRWSDGTVQIIAAYRDGEDRMYLVEPDGVWSEDRGQPQPQPPLHTSAQRAFIDGLRELAAFLQANPEIPATYGVTVVANFNEYGDDDGEPKERLARAVRAAGGRWEKQTKHDTFDLTRTFGPHTLVLFADRAAVCERVVVGTRTVEKPDPDAIIDVPTVTVEEEVVEWVCPPSLLQAAGDRSMS